MKFLSSELVFVLYSDLLFFVNNTWPSSEATVIYNQVMNVPTMQTMMVRVERYEGQRGSQEGNWGKMTSMAVVGHNMNSTLTDSTTSTICDGNETNVIKRHDDKLVREFYLIQEEVQEGKDPDTHKATHHIGVTQSESISTQKQIYGHGLNKIMLEPVCLHFERLVQPPGLRKEHRQ